MGKLFWGCTAAGVALAGGLIGVWASGAYRPDSLAGRYAYALSRTGAVLQSHHTRPATPVKVEGTAYAPCPKARFEPLACEPPLAQPAEEGIVAPNGPAPIVIPEEMADTKELVPPADPDEAGTAPPSYAIEEPEGFMPPQMPICEDDVPPCPKPSQPCFPEEGPSCWSEILGAFGTGVWLRIHDLIETGKQKIEGAAEECGEFEKLWLSLWEYADKDEADQGECREANDAGQQHPGCPDSRGCTRYHHCPGAMYPRYVPTTPPAPKPDEGTTEPMPKKPVGYYFEKAPRHHDVDTMEYRPSDGNLSDFGPGGPF